MRNLGCTIFYMTTNILQNFHIWISVPLMVETQNENDSEKLVEKSCLNENMILRARYEGKILAVFRRNIYIIKVLK